MNSISVTADAFNNLSDAAVFGHQLCGGEDGRKTGRPGTSPSDMEGSSTSQL